jgi:hypothetical protein
MRKNYKVTTNVPPIPELDGVVDSELNLFDPNNPDIALFNLVDDEQIRLSGSKILLYKYYQSEDFDPVYMEARNKPIAKEPVVVYGHYEPKVLEENLTQFGIELTNDQLFIFNKSYIERVAGRGLIPGDVVMPKFQNQKYEIFQVQEDSFEAYGVYHLACSARLLRDSEDVQDTLLTKKADDLDPYLERDVR